jgi:hypothetical protein
MNFKKLLICSAVAFSCSIAYSASHTITTGLGYTVFTRNSEQLDNKQDMLAQTSIPLQYMFTSPKVTAFLISNGAYSSVIEIPYYNSQIKRDTVISGLKTTYGATVGAVFAVYKSNLYIGASYTTPVNYNDTLNDNELTAESEYARQDYGFSQVRFQDGDKYNFNLTYRTKAGIIGGTTNIGYFYNRKYSAVDPGDFILFNIGLNVPVKKWLLDDNAVFIYNTPTYSQGVHGTEEYVQGNSFTNTLSGIKKMADKKELTVLVGGTYYFPGRVGMVENQINSNRNSVLGKIFCDVAEIKAVRITPLLGITHYLKNGYGPNDPVKFARSQTRGEVGCKCIRSINDFLKANLVSNIFFGNNSLLGADMTATIDIGVGK